jgi:hypothetical protein
MLIITGLDCRDDVQLIKKYAYFCLTRFVSNSVLRKSIITIKVVTPEELTSKEDRKDLKEMNAWMFYDGVVNDRKKFTITLAKSVINKKAKNQEVRLKKIFQYLAHELIHVKQYLLNELFDYTEGKVVRYMGDKYSYTDELDWSYWDAPWEIEAYGRSEGLYHKFLQKLKEEKKT